MKLHAFYYDFADSKITSFIITNRNSKYALFYMMKQKKKPKLYYIFNVIESTLHIFTVNLSVNDIVTTDT